MGICFSRRSVKKKPSKRISNHHHHSASSAAAANSSNRWSRIRSSSSSSSKIERFDDAVLHDQALAAAILLKQHQNSVVSAAFDRSASLRHSNSRRHGGGVGGLPRSSSSRARSLTDPLLHPHQLINQDQDVKIDELATEHFVLVHGGGFGAWCWYKTIALLEEVGFKVTAVDLTGSGIHSFDTNNISSMSQYVMPLTDIMDNLADGEKVILVGHDFGGACVSYVMELFPSKISKAVFVAAAMLISGQSALDIFSHKDNTNNLMRRSQIFLYANGNNQPPTAIDLDKSLLGDLLFNQSPAKDIALASVLMRSIPFSPLLEKLSLSDEKYGSVRRFYIETPEDNAIPIQLQESVINSSPPERVLRLKGADHSPFFSRPQTLHKQLVEIAKIV